MSRRTRFIIVRIVTNLERYRSYLSYIDITLEQFSIMAKLIHDEKLIPITDVQLDPTNPNQMTDIQMDGLSESLKMFGFVEPIIVNQDNMLVDGEHRYTAWMRLGHTTIKAIKLDLTGAELKLLRQAKNKLKGQHDIVKDMDELQALLSNYDSSVVAALTGQTTESLEYLISQMQSNQDDLIDVMEHERRVPTDKVYDMVCPFCKKEFNIEDAKNV